MNTKCRNCGSENLVSRGKQWECKQCGSYTSKEYKIVQDANKTVVTSMVPRIMSDNDLLEYLEIDTNIWQLDRAEYGKSEGYRKDRSVEWVVRDGKVIIGDVHDSGKMLIEPLFTVKLFLSRKTAEIVSQNNLDEFIYKAKKFSPVYPKLKYKQNKDGLLFEIAMPDLQLGRVVSKKEAGWETTPEITIKRARNSMDELINYAQLFDIDRILLPVGNDFFDANTAEGMTVHGTPQRDEVRWQKTFQMGFNFMVEVIDKLTALAPVDVFIIPGNHDEERIFYFGEALVAWYHKNPNVRVDNNPMKRAYYEWNKNLIGLTHGYYEKNDKLATLMAFEMPEAWARTLHREWHLGDKHHKVDMIYKTQEMENGVVIRILRSLATPSVWEFDKGFVGTENAAEGFFWHPEKGVIAQFTSPVVE